MLAPCTRGTRQPTVKWCYSSAAYEHPAIDHSALVHCASVLPSFPDPQKADDTYVLLAIDGDLAMMRCLRDLGVAWDPARASFMLAVACLFQCDLAVLTWMVGPGGCPVDWAAVVRQAKGYEGKKVLALVKEVARAHGVELSA